MSLEEIFLQLTGSDADGNSPNRRPHPPKPPLRRPTA